MNTKILVTLIILNTCCFTLFSDEESFKKTDHLLEIPFGLELNHDKLFSLSENLTFQEKQLLYNKHKSDDPWLFFGLNALLPGLAVGSYAQGDLGTAVGVNLSALFVTSLFPTVIIPALFGRSFNIWAYLRNVSPEQAEFDLFFGTAMVTVLYYTAIFTGIVALSTYIYTCVSPWLFVDNRNRNLEQALGEDHFVLAGISRKGHHFELSYRIDELYQLGYMYRFSNNLALGVKGSLSPSEISNISLKALWGNSVDTLAFGFGVGLREIYGSTYYRNIFLDFGVTVKDSTFLAEDVTWDKMRPFLGIGYSVYIGE